MLININKVMELFGVKKSAIYKMISDGILPAPIKVGGSSRWLSNEIEDSVNSMIARRNEPKTKSTRRGRPPRFIAPTNQQVML